MTERGFVVAYRGADTPCPGCGRSNWIVGRISVECAFPRCGTVLPLPDGTVSQPPRTPENERPKWLKI